MPELNEVLPFLIPIVIAELILLVVTLRHIFTHEKYKRGTRLLWVIIAVCIQIIGPILYFVLGREES